MVPWDKSMELFKFATKWTAIAIWFDLSGRFIGAPFDWLFSLSTLTSWLDGTTKCLGGS